MGKEETGETKSNTPPGISDSFSDTIGRKAARKMKARASNETAWFGLGMMGLVGWSVTIPTLLGAALGIWLDNHHPGTISWTLTLLISGLMVGCLNAWHWVAQQNTRMREDNDE
jgi:ATP synthase protein I